jgi:CpcD/allophycocyanin linker domain
MRSHFYDRYGEFDMKSLDINTASTNFSAYSSRQFLIEFTGGSFTGRLQGTATHKVIVPYGSLSKKLKTIQRLGSKVVNVSIHPQLEVLKVNPENAAPEKIAEALKSEVVGVAEITSGTFPEPILPTIAETTHQEVSEANSENISAAPQVVTPKKKKAASESTTSSKKTIAETIPIFEQVLKPEPEIVVETISAIIPEISLKSISEETLPTPPQTEAQESISPLAEQIRTWF